MLTKVVLRQSQDSGGSRYLDAAFDDHGDLVFTGQDLGPAVERFFGCREYEWAWTVRAADLPKLAAALEATGDLLAAIRDRFAGDRAGQVDAFLKEYAIPFEGWSRVGD